MRCPDCNYRISGIVALCPECGARFPSCNFNYRRWATLRIFPDRVDHHSIFFSYCVSLFLLIVRPFSTSRRIAIADRYGRAASWALVHTLLVPSIIVCSIVLNNIDLLSPLHSSRYSNSADGTLSLTQTVDWVRSAFVATWILATLPVIVGLLISLNCGRIHSLFQRTAVKWSLYCTCILPVATLLWMFFNYLAPPLYYQPGPISMSGIGPPRPLPIGYLSIFYGIWWALGVCVNPYLSSHKSACCLRRIVGHWPKLVRLAFTIILPFVAFLAVFCVTYYSIMFLPGGPNWLVALQ